MIALEPTDDAAIALWIEDGRTLRTVDPQDHADLRLGAPTDLLTAFLVGRLPMPELLAAGSIGFERVTYVSLATGLFESSANRCQWDLVLAGQPNDLLRRVLREP